MDEQQQQAHLQQFLRWVIPIIGIFVVIFGLLFALRPESQFIFNALISLGTLVGFVGARALLRRGQFQSAVMIACGMLLALPLAATIISPHLSVVNSLLPLIGAILAVQYMRGPALRTLLLLGWVTMMLVPILGALLPSAVQVTPEMMFSVTLSSFGAIGGVILLLLWQLSRRFGAILMQLRGANQELQATQGDLEHQIAARTHDLQQALGALQTRADEQQQLLNELAQQRAIVRELSVPVIPVSQGTLVMPLVGAFDAERLHNVQEQALQAIERWSAHLLVLDITGVPLVDSHVAQGILTVVQATRLLGAETVLVGIRPEVAQTMVGLGIALPGLRTASSLQAALAE
jgi:rsbT co-antagonist protein RsbR